VLRAGTARAQVEVKMRHVEASLHLQKKRYPRVEDTFWDSLVVELAQALLVTRRRRAKNPKATELVLATPVPAGGRWAIQNQLTYSFPTQYTTKTNVLAIK
jgi:hypothetical protein